jgi:uncharacterized protein (TIGR03067 family)
MRASLFLPVIALLAAAPASAPAQSRLDGAWTAVAASRDGRTADDVVGNKLMFDANKFTITRDGRTLFAGTFSADPAKQPAEIDFANTEGSLKGSWKGLFRLDGETLNICDNAPDMTRPRPAGFEAPAGSGYVFIVFARDKP